MTRTSGGDHSRSGIVAGVRTYLSTDTGSGVFGKGKGELLAAVEKLGSLSNAANRLGRSYRQAWEDINIAETHLGFPLVTRVRGGAGGGSMQLSEQGKQFLRAWEQHSGMVASAVEKSYNATLKPFFNRTEETGNEQ